MIYPSEGVIVVIPNKVEEKTEGGLYMPEVTREREQHAKTTGEFVCAGPGCSLHFTDAVNGGERELRKGDQIIFREYSAVTTKHMNNDQEFWLMLDKDIIAIADKEDWNEWLKK